MATTSSRPKSVLVILRRIYLNIVEGNHCAAKLIDYFKHWRAWKIKNHRTDWVYMPLKQIHEDLMGEHSLHVIRAAIALLDKIGLIKKRRNPNNEQDKTYQYQLNEDVLTSLLKKEQGKLKKERSEFNAEQHTQDQFIDIISTANVGVEQKTESRGEEELTPEASAVSAQSNAEAHAEVRTVNEAEMRDLQGDTLAANSLPITEITKESSTPPTTTYNDHAQYKSPTPTEDELCEVERQLRELRVNAAECKGVIKKYWANVQGAIALVRNFKGANKPIAVFINACQKGLNAPTVEDTKRRSAIPDELLPPTHEESGRLDAAKERREIRDYYFSTVEGITKVVLTGGRQLPWWEFLEVSKC
ncbi:MAG: hypothetical protein KME05_05240 [Gloeocapsa sp. UFS-A4-WI-NPMV-4B04]|jgi:hypothetical protein|nr:hypothetical protein [Gloeocapsa sp. UFS-A4-WI-NPMV-4B04]